MSLLVFFLFLSLFSFFPEGSQLISILVGDPARCKLPELYHDSVYLLNLIFDRALPKRDTIYRFDAREESVWTHSLTASNAMHLKLLGHTRVYCAVLVSQWLIDAQLIYSFVNLKVGQVDAALSTPG
jgi:hypothetical protein